MSLIRQSFSNVWSLGTPYWLFHHVSKKRLLQPRLLEPGSLKRKKAFPKRRLLLAPLQLLKKFPEAAEEDQKGLREPDKLSLEASAFSIHLKETPGPWYWVGREPESTPCNKVDLGRYLKAAALKWSCLLLAEGQAPTF